MLTNQRHELFAQALAKGKSATEAYVEAGYKDNRQHAHRLVTKGYVQDRVAELQQRAAIRTEVTIESLTAEFDEARAMALMLKQPAAVIAASREKAVLHGLRIEKRENLNRNINAEHLSDAEIADRIAALRTEPVNGAAKAPGDPSQLH